MAAGAARILVAWSVNLAESTSASAAMAQQTRIGESAAALLKLASGDFMAEDDVLDQNAAPHLSAIISKAAMASHSVTTDRTARASTTLRNIVCARSMRVC